MKDSKRDKIITDLLTKRPKGPKGSCIVYAEKEVYDALADKYRVVIVSENCENFGYSASELFDMNLHTSESAKLYLIDRFYNSTNWCQLTKGQGVALARRLNRLWFRIKDPIR